LKLKYDKLLSTFAFIFKWRPYLVEEELKELEEMFVRLGGAVQVDPGFSQLTPRLLSALETKI